MGNEFPTTRSVSIRSQAADVQLKQWLGLRNRCSES